ncbi:MAG: class I SAM-dependent methyltransferase [Planctomycetota bacterium]
MRRFQHPVFALQYDLSEGDRSRLGDCEWYARRLDRYRGRGPILELGAGTGRITLPLARSGHDLIATDIGHAMLRLLRGKLTSQAAFSGSVRTVCADMRRLPLPDQAATAAFSAYNSLGCLLEPADLARSCAEVHRLLAPGAPFLFDVPVPGPTEPYVANGPPRQEEWEPCDGGVIRRTATVLTPSAPDRLSLEYAFQWRDATGAAGEETVRFELNTWPPARYAELAEAAGFAVADLEEPTFLDRRGRERAWAFFELRRR